MSGVHRRSARRRGYRRRSECDVYLKREDLNHTGAHKINSALGQALLARRMGKRRIIAETGAGQHGVATATVCARFGLDCTVYMGEEDMRRQQLNVYRMRLMGAKVVPVLSGTRTLKDATSEAIRDWVTNVEDSYYIIGSVVGPAPYPAWFAIFSRSLGARRRRKCSKRLDAPLQASSRASAADPTPWESSTPLSPIPRSNWSASRPRARASIRASTPPRSRAASPACCTASLSYLLQDENGQVHPAHSISAGLDYPGVGPEHSYLKETGRALYVSVTDDEAVEGLGILSRLEGIIPALETSHAVAWVVRERAVDQERRGADLHQRSRRQGCRASN